jgi:uncharacterized MAPEG superfamily protein
MNEVVCLELSIVLWFAHILVQSAFANRSVGAKFLAGNRDDERPHADVGYARATRALRNYIENMVPFVAADLGLLVTHHAPEWGAPLWIAARILYLPAYVMGQSPGRTILWVISMIGLVVMLVSLAL